MAKVTAVVKMQLQAGKANPAPPVGTALGPHGVNMPGFCQEFNDKTKEMGNDIIPVEVTIYDDRSFTFVCKTPPASYLVKKILNLKSGSAKPHAEKVAKITRAQLEEIANQKMEDLNANDIDAAVKIIEGTCRQMGVTVEG